MIFIFLLLNSDTTAVDTNLYEIPEIIDYEPVFRPLIEIKLNDFDALLPEALLPLPLTILQCGYGRLSFINPHPVVFGFKDIYLNGHPLNNEPSGYFNLNLIPAHFFKKVTLSTDFSGPCINLCSRVNESPRPFSYIRYGNGDFEENLYNFGLARPLSDKTGIYIDGLYHKYVGLSLNQNFQLFSIYTNLYNNHFLPMRLDIFYSTNEHNALTDSLIDGTENFFDLDLTVQKGRHKVCLNYNATKTPFYALKKYWLSTTADYNIRLCNLIWKFSGTWAQIENSGFNPGNRYLIDAGIRLARSLGRFSISSFGYGAHTDMGDHYYPGIELGFYLSDSCLFNFYLYKNFQEPSWIQTRAAVDTFFPLFKLKGNEELVPSTIFYQGFRAQTPYIFLDLYRINYENGMMVFPDSNDFYIYKNCSLIPSTGLSGYLNLPLEFSDVDTNTTTRISVKFSGYHLFKADSFVFTPRDLLKIETRLSRETKRFGITLRLWYKRFGTTFNVNRNEIDGFQTVSGGAGFRFINLYLYLRATNLLNLTYSYIPQYEMPQRRFSFTIKWEFWD